MGKRSSFCHAALFAAASFVPVLISTDAAHAIINGSSSSLGVHMVRIIGPKGTPNCSGVVLDKTHVVTAGHCGPRAVLADGGRIAVARVSQNAVLEDGRRVSVRGDATIITLRAPLSGSHGPIQIGTQGEGTFTIAGFGALTEAQRGTIGPLYEATVVQHVPFRLVDPRRDGDFSASACYGDSGGAVIQNGALVGIITRASHPSPRFVCGHLTHYTPIIATSFAPPPNAAAVNASVDAAPQVVPRRPRMYRRNATRR